MEARIKGVATNRTFDAIFRLAEAQAKLNLSYAIDDDIVTQIMQSLSLMLSQYGEIVKAIESPKGITYNAFLNILKQNKAPLSIEAYFLACFFDKIRYSYSCTFLTIFDRILRLSNNGNACKFLPSR
jgi:hypothetical protein